MNDNENRTKVQVYNYESLKKLGIELGRPASTLYALSPANDPFYIGPARQADGKWFADLFAAYMFRSGVHLRRVHYVVVSQPAPVLMCDGTPYENTEACWQKLLSASVSARCLNLVPIGAFVDKRNPEPVINANSDVEYGAELNIAESSPSELPVFGRFPDLPHLELYAPAVRQPFLVEIWAEKSTVNDILLPLGTQYGVNIVTGAGELSLTACHSLLERAKEDGRPVRILYVSDFDPAGRSMPVAVARKIEFLNQQVGLDIQVRPVVLTAEQCQIYQLPRTPIKETERRAAEFEARFGEGATELDALEALHPGELRKILETEILRYRDSSVEDQIEETAEEIEGEIDNVNAEVHSRYAPQIDELKSEYTSIKESAVVALRNWHSRAAPIWRAIKAELNAAAPDLSDIDWPTADVGDEDDDPLFDSNRSYVEQMDRYKDHQGKPTSRRGGS
jgi:hypothetical protein